MTWLRCWFFTIMRYTVIFRVKLITYMQGLTCDSFKATSMYTVIKIAVSTQWVLWAYTYWLYNNTLFQCHVHIQKDHFYIIYSVFLFPLVYILCTVSQKKINNYWIASFFVSSTLNTKLCTAVCHVFWTTVLHKGWRPVYHKRINECRGIESHEREQSWKWSTGFISMHTAHTVIDI